MGRAEVESGSWPELKQLQPSQAGGQMGTTVSKSSTVPLASPKMLIALQEQFAYCFLYGDDPEDSVGVLIVKGKMRDAVVLVVGDGKGVPIPLNGRWGVGLNFALQIHVKLEGLTQPFTGDAQHRGKLNLE